jgi:hypothetical protein
MGSGEVRTGFWWGRLRERDSSEIVGVYEMKIDLQKVGWGVEWIYLVQVKEKWWVSGLW